jgi:protein-tyrosine phosphatase
MKRLRRSRATDPVHVDRSWRRALGRPSNVVPLLLLSLVATACGPDLYEGMPPHVERRHLALEGAPNFRDLGGYVAEDGRSVKWGMFYRSDNLSELTPEDLERLSSLGIRLVCDLRGPSEWTGHPDRLPAVDPPEVSHLEIWDESFDADGIRAAILSGDFDVDLRQMLIDGNRMFATRFADRYRDMFARIREPLNLPALVHCTAGKDRAGFASALILRTLGVPISTVYEDFLLTNHYTASKIERTLLAVRVMSLFRVDPERVRPVLGVEPAYLDAAFAAIEENYGSFDTYRRDALGLDDAALERFRDMALE